MTPHPKDSVPFEAEAPARPSRARMFPVVWLSAFIVVTIFQAVAGPTLERWPLPVRTLLLSGVMVAVIMGVVEPVVSRVLRRASR
jgi:antibiotic biosynthesis monooxygenase (ABM) superfamily enzyme